MYKRLKTATALIVLFFLLVGIIASLIIVFSINDDGQNNPNENYYQVRLEPNGGQIINPASFTINEFGYYIRYMQYGDFYGTLPTAERRGYVFEGWSTTDSPNDIVASNDVISQQNDFSLYAIWEWVGVQVSYNIAYVDQLGNYIAESVQAIAMEGSTANLDSYVLDIYGYTFDPTRTNLTPTINENRTYNIVYTPNTYYIEYSVDDEIIYSEITEYVYGTEIAITTFDQISLNDDRFNREGYHFVGWTSSHDSSLQLSDGELVNKDRLLALGLDPQIPGSTLTLVAVYEPNIYTINYDGKGGGDYSAQIPYDTIINAPTRPNKVGFMFVGWFLTDTGDNGLNISGLESFKFGTERMPADNIQLYAGYTIIEYTLTLNLSGGSYPVGESNPNSYTVLDSFTLVNPVIDGMEFLGWTGTGLETPQVVVTIMGMTGNREYTANFGYTSYSINLELAGGYYTDGNPNPDYYTIVSEPITIVNPIRDGYTFVGWTGTNLAGQTPTITIPTGSSGDRIYTAHWQLNTYNIIYEAGAGAVFNPTRTTYTVEMAPFDLEIPTRTGYEFAGWSIGDETPQVNYRFNPTEHIGGATVTAHWTTADYAITYDYNTGSPSADGYYPTSYTINDEIRPSAPEKVGYTFAGWVLLNEYSIELGVDYIAQGSTGNRTFRATWTPNTDTVYTVEIYLMNTDGTYPRQPSETTTGTGTSDEMTTYTPLDREFYITPNAQSFTISADGSTVIEVRYARVEFTVTILGNGVGNESVTSHRWGDTVSLTANTLPGYSFAQWVQTEGTTVTFDGSRTSINFVMPTDDIELTMTTSLITYYISYSLNGGTVDAGTPNPTEYNVETATFTLNNPTRLGYEFTGWSIGGGQPTTVVTITQGSTGDRDYTANWTLEVYSITYNLGDDAVLDTNYHDFTIVSQAFSLDTPTRAGYDFAGWTGTGLDEPTFAVRIPTGSTGDREYTATWTPRNDTPYTILTYLMDENGSYPSAPSSTTNDVGTTGSTVTYEAPDIPGYITPADEQVVINADGSSNVVLRYARQQFSITVTTHGVQPISTESYYWGATVTLNANVLNGYNFGTWEQTSGNPVAFSPTNTTISFTMPQSSIEMSATGTPISYTISYDLAGGSVATPNPTEYNVETATFTLNNPTALGLEFLGWTGTGLSEATLTVEITQGSTGDRSYTATWGPARTNYTINHYQQNLENDEYTLFESEQASGYANDNVNAPTKSYEGFTTPSVQEVFLEPDGSTVVNYYYTRNSYSVSITNGEGITSTSGANTYKYGASVTLTVAVDSYYLFNGWELDGDIISNASPYEFTIGAREYEFTAVARGETYNIYYDYNAGNDSVGNTDSLPTSYQYSSESQRVYGATITRLGYVFIGWQTVGSEDQSVQYLIMINPGTHGDITLKAAWGTSDNAYFAYTLLDDGTVAIGANNDNTITLPNSVNVPAYVYLTRTPPAQNTDGSPQSFVSNGLVVSQELYESGDPNTYRVTAIRGGIYNEETGGSSVSNISFANKNFSTITLPSTITSIGVSSFYHCTSLTTINGGSNVISIGANAFDSCSSLTQFEFPSRLTTLGSRAFQRSGLTSITVPSHITNIAPYVFATCTSLESAIVNTSISDGMFFQCTSLTSITGNYTTIGQGAFQQCSSLRTISFPSTLTNIENVAFLDIGLTSISFANNTNLTTIGQSAFNGNKRLTSVVFGSNMTIGTIGQSAFYNCYMLPGVTFGSGTTLNTIGQSAFAYCTNLRSINVPTSIQRIEDYAFSDDISLYNLGDIITDNNLTYLGENAFQNCVKIYEFYIPSTLTQLGPQPFNQCYNLKFVHTDGQSLQASQLFPSEMEYSINNVEIGRYDTSFEYNLVRLSNGIVLADKKVKSGTNAFEIANHTILIGYTGTQNIIDLRNGTGNQGYEITKIAPRAFAFDLNIEEIYLPSDIYVVEEYAFINADNLTTVLWEYESRTSVMFDLNAFKGAHKLVRAAIPYTVTSEGSTLFMFDSPGVELLHSRDSTDFATTITTEGDFEYVNFGGTSEYTGQKWLIDYVGTSTSVNLSGQTNIYNGVFYGNTTVENVTLPSNMTSIPAAMFSFAMNLTSINIPSTVTSIGEYAFMSAFSLESANISDLTNLTTMGGSAFELCINLSSEINISGTLAVLEDRVFRACHNATFILNEGLQRIEEYAFQNIPTIVTGEFTIPSTVTYIDENAFFQCEDYTPPFTGNRT